MPTRRKRNVVWRKFRIMRNRFALPLITPLLLRYCLLPCVAYSEKTLMVGVTGSGDQYGLRFVPGRRALAKLLLMRVSSS